jgi:tetratricopeptide (TPR) repeat protein
MPTNIPLPPDAEYDIEERAEASIRGTLLVHLLIATVITIILMVILGFTGADLVGILGVLVGAIPIFGGVIAYLHDRRKKQAIRRITAEYRAETASAPPEVSEAQPPTITASPPTRPETTPTTPFRHPPKVKLIGRTAEVKTLKRKLEEERGGIVVLRGLGGVGKSTLAADAYWNYAAALCPDGVYWLDVRDGDIGVALRSLLVHQFGENSNALPTDAVSLAGVWQGKIRGKSVFLVVDNAESLASNLKAQLEWVRVPPPGITLVTSRNTVSIADDIEIKRFTEQDALRYLQEKLKWSVAERKAQESDGKALIEFLGGLALGLKLTVDLMIARGQDCAAALAHLKQVPLMELPALEVGERTLLAAFILSYNPLPDDAKSVFQLVGVCAKTGTTLDAITAMVQWQPQRVQAAFDTLNHYSLIEMRNGRIELHPALHEFASYQAQQSDEYERLEQSHVRYYGITIGGLLEQAIEREADVQRALTTIDNEIDNVRLAQVRALAPQFKEARLAVQVMDALRQFWSLRKAPELETWLAATLALAKKTGQTHSQAGIHQAIGDIQAFRKDNDNALGSYSAALSIFQTIGDHLGQANTLQVIGNVQAFRNDYEAALASYTEALSIFRTVENRIGEANTLQAIGHIQAFRNDYDVALVSYSEALAIFKRIDERLGEANALQAMGDIQKVRHDYEPALAAYTEALAIYKTFGAKLGEANTLQAMGDVQTFRNEPENAHTSYNEALTIFRMVGDRLGEANTYMAIARLQKDESAFVAALAIYEEIHDVYSSARGKYYYAKHLVEQQQIPKARKLYQEARAAWLSINQESAVRIIDEAVAELNP